MLNKGRTPSDEEVAERIANARVALLFNFITPHKLPIYVELAKHVGEVTVLQSVEMEPNREWKPETGGLDVRTMKTTTFNRTWKHPVGFSDAAFIHIPWGARRMLKEIDPDIIITAELGFRSMFSAWHRRRRPKTRLIYWLGLSEHTERGRPLTRRMLRKWLIRQADTVLVNGKSGARYLNTQLKLPTEKTFQIPYPTLPSQFDSLPDHRDADSAHHLLFVGQLIERKGVVPFSEAICKWAEANPDRKVEFTLAGSGPLEQTLRSIPTPENLTIRLLGQCSYDELTQWYGRAGIFVFPTFADDWGMATNEGMTAGLPVLGSIYGQAVDEMVVDGETGWRYRADHEDEIISAIDAAMNTSVDQLNVIRKRARDRVRSRTPQVAVQHILEAMHESYFVRGGWREAQR